MVSDRPQALAVTRVEWASMLQNRGHEENVQTLPKQAVPPTVEQIKHMQTEAQETSRVVQIPFGDVPEDYILMVMYDKAAGYCKWRLEKPSRGDVEWEESNRAAHEIYTLIIRRAMMPSQSQSEQFRTLRTKTHRPTLEGELQDMSLPTLSQSIQMNTGTGRLEIESSSGFAFVFFVQGEPVHCMFNDSDGDDAFLELCSISEGKFRFYKEPKTTEKTITKALQVLLMEGAKLSDHLTFLKGIGVGLETYLIRNHSTMSETLFEQMVKDGVGCAMDLQKRFYQEVDNQSTVLEILRRVPLPKSRWIPIVFNLVTCGLCAYREKVPDLAATRDTTIDWTQVKRVESLMRRPDTGVYTYPAFLLFLEKEFFRYERFKSQFAVVTLDIKVRRKEAIEPLPPQSLSEVIKRVNNLIRRTDILCHYEALGFAILMPETGLESARIFALRLAEIIMSVNLNAEKGSYPIVASVGFAAIPESCESLGALLALAQAPSR